MTSRARTSPRLRPVIGGSAAGLAITKGRLTGPTTAWRFAGDGTFSNLDAFGISALTMTGQYDVTIPSGPANPSAAVTGRASFMKIFGQEMQEASGTITLAADRADFNLTLTQVPGRTGGLAGAILLHSDRQAIDLLNLTVTLGAMPWRLVRSDVPPTLSWNDAGLTISPTTFATGQQNDQRVAVAGTWRYDGGGALHVTATHAFLETFQNTQNGPPRYGGVVDLDAIIRGTRNAPLVTGTIAISNGRIERVTYEKLAGRVDYSGGLFDIDLRLDQAPGTWLTAKGKVPLALFNRDLGERPIDLTIQSSPVDLGLLAGVTESSAAPPARFSSTCTRSARAAIRISTARSTSPTRGFSWPTPACNTRTAARRSVSPPIGSPWNRFISRTRRASRSRCAEASARTSCGSATWPST